MISVASHWPIMSDYKTKKRNKNPPPGGFIIVPRKRCPGISELPTNDNEFAWHGQLRQFGKFLQVCGEISGQAIKAHVSRLLL